MAPLPPVVASTSATPASPPGVAEAQAPAEDWLLPYDMACAYARAGDERAEPTLDLALERGGEPVRVRALKDGAFERVRTTAWFRRMVGSP